MPASHSTPALGTLASEAATFPDGVPDSQSIQLLPAVDSSANNNIINNINNINNDNDNNDDDDDDDDDDNPSDTEDAPAYPLIHKISDAPNHLSLSGRIINVLPNLPYALCRDNNTYTLRHRRGNSALYSALAEIHAHPEWESLLVGWVGEIEGEAASQQPTSPTTPTSPSQSTSPTTQIPTFPSTYGEIHPVWLDGDPSDYRAYAENIIWPILHYIQGQPTDGVKEQGWWRRYVAMNEAYAEQVTALYRPGDIVWVHDYYLLLLPQLLRMRLPKAYIAFFLHSPFPSSEYFRVLPRRKDLLEGMLGANLVATQSYNFARHFISACTRLLNLESRPTYISAYGVHVSVDTIPIGIDAVAVERTAFSTDVDAKVRALNALYPGMKLIIGRDRLDSVRGVVQKLYAFEMFLTLYPEWVGKVVLIQVTSPAYFNAAKTDKKIAEMVAKINGTYGSLDYSPIQHYPRHIARDEYLALLRAADLGLITSVRDGMNTTSLEFVVCQKQKHSPLVLSEFTGTAGLLVDSIQVNPWDSIGVAQTINQCLLQSSERNADIESHLYQTVTHNTVQDWVMRNISRLVHNLSRHDQSFLTPTLDRILLAQKYNAATNRLFMFDYDGTLTSIVREPSAAIPSARLYKSLQLLTQDPRNRVWIISGRDAKFLDKWLGPSSVLRDSLGFSAEHGCFFKAPGAHTWTNLAQEIDMSWRQEVLDVFSYFTERTQGSHIETKEAAITWHYRRADPELGSFQAAELKKQLERELAPKYDIEIMAGKANVEVRPRQFNKGEVVKELVKRCSSEGKRPDFILCSGDDKPDEDMFKAVRAVSNVTEEASKKVAGQHKQDANKSATGQRTKPKTQSAARRRSQNGYFSVTVGPANKRTSAAWHLADPEAVLETLSILSGETSLQDVPGMGE